MSNNNTMSDATKHQHRPSKDTNLPRRAISTLTIRLLLIASSGGLGRGSRNNRMCGRNNTTTCNYQEDVWQGWLQQYSRIQLYYCGNTTGQSWTETKNAERSKENAKNRNGQKGLKFEVIWLASKYPAVKFGSPCLLLCFGCKEKAERRLKKNAVSCLKLRWTTVVVVLLTPRYCYYTANCV